MSNEISGSHAPEVVRVGERLELAEVDEGDDVVDDSGEQDELACSQLHV